MKSREDQLHDYSISTREFIDTVVESAKSHDWKIHSIRGALYVLADLGTMRGGEKRKSLRPVVRIGPINKAAADHTFATRLEPYGYIIDRLASKYDGVNTTLVCKLEDKGNELH